MSKNIYKTLEAVEILVGGGLGMDAEMLMTPYLTPKPKKVVSQLRRYAGLITEIYMIVHAENSKGCSHSDWEKIKYKIIADHHD